MMEIVINFYYLKIFKHIMKITAHLLLNCKLIVDEKVLTSCQMYTIYNIFEKIKVDPLAWAPLYVKFMVIL